MPFLYHPLIVHFPVALWMTGTFFDLLYLAQRKEFYATAARWLIGLGLLGAVVSIGSGWFDLLRQEALGIGTALRLQHRLHSVPAYAATVAYLVVFLARWRRPTPAGWTVALSLAGAALVAVANFVGGELRKVM